MVKTISLMLLTAAWLAACTSTPPTSDKASPATDPALPASMKGYELYSWQSDSEWHFALMTGTNRSKMIEEIISGPDTVTADGWVRLSVQGVGALRDLLGRLPAHQTIVWIGRQQLEQAGVEPDAIELPPQETIDSIRETCEQLQLDLVVGDGPGEPGGPGTPTGAVPADFMLTLDARRANDRGAQHVAIRVDAKGAGRYEIYDSRGTISQDGEGRVVYQQDQVLETGEFDLDAEQLGRLWQAIEENRFFDLTQDYRMQIGLSYAFVAVQAGGRKHQVFNIGMEVAGIRAIVEAVDRVLPEEIGVMYGEGYVP